MDKLLLKGENFEWTTKYQNEFTQLKHKLVSAPIIVFPYW